MRTPVWVRSIGGGGWGWGMVDSYQGNNPATNLKGNSGQELDPNGSFQSRRELPPVVPQGAEPVERGIGGIATRNLA